MAPGWYPDPMQAGHQRQWDGQQWVGPSVPLGGNKKGGFPKWAIPLIACLALAFGAIVIGAIAGGGDDEPSAERTSSEDSTTSEPDEPQSTASEVGEDEPTTTEEPTTTAPTTTTTTAPPAPDGSQERPLPIGSATRVGDYDVTLTSLTFDATDAVMAENMFNEAPDQGAFALVTINATYVGDTEGQPGFDLAVTFQGGDGRQTRDSECGASLDPGPYDAPTIVNGGSTEVRFCWNYSPAAVEGSIMFIEPLVAFTDEERRYWATR